MSRNAVKYTYWDSKYINRIYDSIEKPQFFIPYSIELDKSLSIPQDARAFDRHHTVEFKTKEDLLKTLPKGTWALPTHGIADPKRNCN